jgi:hypothetical protein
LPVHSQTKGADPSRNEGRMPWRAKIGCDG